MFRCRFMRAHIPNLKEKVRENHLAPKQHNKSLQDEWKHTLRKLCKQLLPFMVSCVQIASKLCSHYNVSLLFSSSFDMKIRYIR